MKALVTGGNGFLGQYVVEQLVARGDQVVSLCRKPCPALENIGIRVTLGNLGDIKTLSDVCRGVDAVFHVAGVAGMGGPWRYYYAANVQGTQNVVDACRAAGVGRLIFTSSPSVTFDGRDQCGVDESAPYARRWLCCYAKSKAMAEQIVLSANGPSLLTCALRPHLIWGPRDRHLLPTIINASRQGRLRRVGDGNNLVDITYVENAAAAHLAAADALRPGSPVAGNAYFISQGEPVNCWVWIDKVLRMAGAPPLQKAISFPAAYAAGTICDAIYKTFGLASEPPITRFMALQFSRSHYFDISRAQRDFGYKPAITTDEGLHRLAAAGFVSEGS